MPLIDTLRICTQKSGLESRFYLMSVRTPWFAHPSGPATIWFASDFYPISEFVKLAQSLPPIFYRRVPEDISFVLEPGIHLSYAFYFGSPINSKHKIKSRFFDEARAIPLGESKPSESCCFSSNRKWPMVRASGPEPNLDCPFFFAWSHYWRQIKSNIKTLYLGLWKAQI